jgi:hypothetical protein
MGLFQNRAVSFDKKQLRGFRGPDSLPGAFLNAIGGFYPSGTV